MRWPRIELGSIAWKATMLTTIPPSLDIDRLRHICVATTLEISQKLLTLSSFLTLHFYYIQQPLWLIQRKLDNFLCAQFHILLIFVSGVGFEPTPSLKTRILKLLLLKQGSDLESGALDRSAILTTSLRIKLSCNTRVIENSSCTKIYFL